MDLVIIVGIITFILGAIAGGIGGYKLGIYFVNQMNQTLQVQNNMLTGYSERWSEMARNASLLNSEIAHQNTSNVNASMGAVIQMLNVIQREQAHTMNNEQQLAINKIIDEAKSISPSSEFE